MNKSLLIVGLMLGLMLVATYAFAGGCGMPNMSCGSDAAPATGAQPAAQPAAEALPPAENMLQLTGTVLSIAPNGAALVDTGTAKIYVVAPPAPTEDGTPPASPFKVGDRIQVAGVLLALSIQPTPATPAATAATVYTCPMHPEVTSTRPGRCPKCGMNLVKQVK